jgi:hypothetical protein
MCRITHPSRVFVLACLALMAAAEAHAAPRTREQRETEARTACAAGRVEAGIEVLAQLLTEYGHPNYIYNQARCYQQNGKAEQAISRFREFLRAAQDISPEERARVERFIKELESELPAPPPAATPGTEAAPAPNPVAQPEPQPPPPAVVFRPAAAPPPERSRNLRTAAVALGVLGVAGVTTGIVSTLQVRSLETEVETAKIGQFTGPRLIEQQEKAHKFETLQWVGYGVGAAALGGAVVCLVLDSRESADQASAVRLIGTLGPDRRPGLVLAGRF